MHHPARRASRRRAALGLIAAAASLVAATTTAAPASAATWPSASTTKQLSSTLKLSGSTDAKMTRYVGTGDLGGSSQDEGQDPLITLADGATLSNAVIGSPGADGIHCLGSCTLNNVWWEDVGEDAATFKGTSSSTRVLVNGGGARKASDKVFQHNGGGTVTIQNFQVSDFGKLYRSCGNCSKQYKRTVVVKGLTATAPGKTLVGINTNYGDTATLSAITVVGDSSRSLKICERYQGNSTGDEPKSLGTGPGSGCNYTTADVTYR
ncbi:pectate lyase [Kineococcus arenarius]|uniref:pectate lyase n=1 Tax=unclassified Kineococcus TaxID=2621656 RepID=UPI003D7E6E2D